MSIGGFATQPSFKNPGYIPNNDGQAVIYPGMFGVVNNIKVDCIDFLKVLTQFNLTI